MKAALVTQAVVLVILLQVLSQCSTRSYVPGYQEDYLAPQGRSWNFFNIVRGISNDICEGDDGSFGTCRNQLECSAVKGNPSGKCSRGLGLCCVIERTCGGSSDQNETYFMSPGYPEALEKSLTCDVTIYKQSRDVCQMKVEFLEFEIERPTAGNCINDVFTITGQNSNNVVPNLCGVNTGQHFFVDVDQSDAPLKMFFKLVGQGSRTWKLLVHQIPCTSSSKAPTNCLQYFMGKTGELKSFNYDEGITSSVSIRQGYLNNMDYAMCIRKEAGHCKVTYSNRDGTTRNYFEINNISPTVGPSIFRVLQTGVAGAGRSECPDDYLNLNGVAVCGERLNSQTFGQDPVIDAPIVDESSGPFIAKFRSDDYLNGRGFLVRFDQEPCGTFSLG